MKITRSRLKQIIKEEMEALYEEKQLPMLQRWNRWAKATDNKQVDQDYINRAKAMVVQDEEKWGDAWYRQLLKISDWEKEQGLATKSAPAKPAAAPAKPAAKPADDPAVVQKQLDSVRAKCQGAKGTKISLCRQRIAALELRLEKASQTATGGPPPPRGQ